MATPCTNCSPVIPIPTTICPTINYLDTDCGITSVQLKCTYWSGLPVTSVGILTGDTGDVVINKLATQIATITGGQAFDKFFRISATDTVSSYFMTKILAGTGIILTQGNIGANENITISVNQSAILQTPLTVTSIDKSISFVVSGVNNHTVDLGVKLSAALNNGLQKLSDGMWAKISTSKALASPTDTTESYLMSKLVAGTNVTLTLINPGLNEQIRIAATAPSGLLASVTTLDTATIGWSGTGTAASPLSSNVKLSATVGNAAVINADGLFVSTPATVSAQFLTWDTPSRTLTLSGGGGSVVIPNPPTFVETGLTANSSSTILFTTSGTSNHTLTASVIISTDTGNALTTHLNGLYVQNTLTPVASTNTSSVNIFGTGISGTPLYAVVRVSGITNNLITTNADGIYATYYTIALTGDVAGSGTTSIATTIQPAAVTYAKIQNVTTQTLLGRWAATTGTVQEITLGTGITLNSTTGVLSASGTGGSVTSVGLSLPSIFTVTGSPVTTTGTLTGTLATQTANTVFAGPSTGAASAPTFRTLVAADLPISISGTLNYVSKFTSATSIGNSQIFDNGTAVGIGTTSLTSFFNVVGQSLFSNTTTYTSGTSSTINDSTTTTFTGVLPTGNVSFSSINNSFTSIINGNTTVSGSTPFGATLNAITTSFSTTGTLTMSSFGGTSIKASCAIEAQCFDSGTINGTITNSAGVMINGIFLTAGSTAVITRTNHYQLLINDSNEFGNGANITNKFAIYQAGANDISRFFGPVQNATSVLQFTSDIRVKENIVPFTRGLKEIEQLHSRNFNFTYNKKNVTGIIAQELEEIIPEAVSKCQFDSPDGRSFDDFRMVDQNIIFYTMLNSIKELSAKVKILEAKLS